MTKDEFADRAAALEAEVMKLMRAHVDSLSSKDAAMVMTSAAMATLAEVMAQCAPTRSEGVACIQNAPWPMLIDVSWRQRG